MKKCFFCNYRTGYFLLIFYDSFAKKAFLHFLNIHFLFLVRFTIAWACIAFWVPISPSPLAVVAFIETCSGSIESILAIFSFISPMYWESFGCSVIITVSIFIIL